jgi:hypothetical protein
MTSVNPEGELVLVSLAFLLVAVYPFFKAYPPVFRRLKRSVF